MGVLDLQWLLNFQWLLSVLGLLGVLMKQLLLHELVKHLDSFFCAETAKRDDTDVQE